MDNLNQQNSFSGGNPEKENQNVNVSQERNCENSDNSLFENENPNRENPVLNNNETRQYDNSYETPKTPYQNFQNRYTNPYSGNQNYPYANQNGYYGNNTYGSPYSYYPPKKPLMQKIKNYFLDSPYRNITVISSLVALSVIGFQVMAAIFSAILGSNENIYALYSENHIFSVVVEMFYTMFCVGMPFAFSYVIMRKLDGEERFIEPLPFGTPRKKLNIFLLVLAGFGICYIGNVLTNLFANYMAAFGIEFVSYNYAMTVEAYIPKNAWEFILMSMHTALFPALFEEFAFRGVIMQPLRKFGDWYAIIISAVLFGLVHGNMTQMPFAIIAGIAIGYTVTVTGSIWTGVLLHFLNNFSSLVYSLILETIAPEKLIVFSLLYVYGIILVGVVAIAGYIYSNPNFIRLYPSKYLSVSKKRTVGVFFLTPPMIVALVILFFNIAADIII